MITPCARSRRFHPLPLLAGLVLGATVLAAPAGAAEPTAQYTVRFDATWSAQSHPVAFPDNAHFSPLVGGTHDSRVRFWRQGDLASPGIQNMAEAGQVSPLDDEVRAAIGRGRADQVLKGGDTDSPGSVSLSFTIRQEFPLVTLVTMVAPSPDWFVGVAGLPLLENGEWVEERVVRLVPWDAGTDSGGTFRTQNQPTTPHRPISHITTGPLGAGARFLGTYTFTRTDVAAPAALRLGEGNRFAVRVQWERPDGVRGAATPVELTEDSGYVWFFDPSNIELVVKVLDACAVNGRFWVFAAGLTNVGVVIEVEDTRTGATRTYRNPVNRPFAPLQDTAAFANCS
jgi:hypothetical protein